MRFVKMNRMVWIICTNNFPLKNCLKIFRKADIFAFCIKIGGLKPKKHLGLKKLKIFKDHHFKARQKSRLACFLPG